MRKYIILIAILLVNSIILIGCNNDKQEQDQGHDEEVSYNEVKNLTFIEAIEEYPVWINSSSDYDALSRDDTITEIYYFKDGKVTIYVKPWGQYRKIEEIRDLSSKLVLYTRICIYNYPIILHFGTIILL